MLSRNCKSCAQCVGDVTDDELIKFKNDYNKLSNVTATKVLEFWSEQQKTAR
jgi:hypothetical protein